MRARLVLAHGQMLLAQTRASDGTSSPFAADGADTQMEYLVTLVVVLSVIAGVVWTVTYIRGRGQRANYCSPRQLFNELCAHHQLDWPTRKLLRQLARFRHPEHPARIFLDPACFDAAGIPPQLQSFREELVQLKVRLF